MQKQEAMNIMSTSYKTLSAVFLLAVILGVSIPLAIVSFYPPVINKASLPRFASYEELKAFVNTTAPPPYYLQEVDLGVPRAKTEALTGNGGVEYSKTNIQVEGVDEADIVKSDGTYIYMVSEEKVTIVRAQPPEEVQVVTSISIGEAVRGIFINEGKLVVFSNTYAAIKSIPEKRPNFEKTSIRVYNIENRAKPRLVRNVTLEGNYFDSRMIGNYAYVVISQPAYPYDGNIPLPIIESNGMVDKIEATHIYYANITDYAYAFTTVVAVNVKNDREAPAHETFLLGFTGEIYVSLNNIYIAVPGYVRETQSTNIHRILIADGKISHEASGTVQGYVLNQFSMDEYEGYFRIATTTGHIARFFEQATSINNVYILDMNLEIKGKIENLAPGERIYSARFIGKRGYLVTFKKVDPLFVLSLEDPANPSVLGKLKIPGYSDYLHPYDDIHLIGIGKNTVEAEEGDFAWYQGIKISMFDVSDVSNPKEIANISIGDRGTDSPVLRDHKALLFDKKLNLLAIPVLLAKINESKYPQGVPLNAYGEYVWQGLYVLNLNKNSITLKGRITHIENTEDLIKAGYYFSSEYSVERSLYIDNVLYTISGNKMKMNSLTDLGEIGQVKLS